MSSLSTTTFLVVHVLLTAVIAIPSAFSAEASATVSTKMTTARASSTSSLRRDVHILMYETDSTLEWDLSSALSFFKERTEIADIPTTVFGGKQSYQGFGDKYSTLRPILEIMEQSKLVIVADARDVALNVPADTTYAEQAVDRFLDTFSKLTKNTPGAIVMSAEAQCCVSAMSNAFPHEYFNSTTGDRTKRACSSGHEDCPYEDNDRLGAWKTFMDDRAYNSTGTKNYGDIYLNAGLMAGYPQDLINMLDLMDIHPAEDDQAVLSGLLYSFPDKVVLDYRQEMFGNNQWPRGLLDGCIFDTQGPHLPLIHSETKTQPLILHTPGKFYDCLDSLIDALGGESQKRYLPQQSDSQPEPSSSAIDTATTVV
mmetsp:Transcript_10837/g.25850  ORF Transcript_10837/g.25850 Transcript_10837/m.25850 type:complete len:369 (+) Transcript_10837:127-1233(+)